MSYYKLRVYQSTSKPEAKTESEYRSRLAYMYVWELVGKELGLKYNPIKIGFAKAVYKRADKYVHGGEGRIIGNLRDIERAFGMPFDTLKAYVHMFKLADWEDVLGAEQFVHARNADEKVMNILDGTSDGKLWNRSGGKSEWYNMPLKTALGRARNSWRKSNIALGRGKVLAKRTKGEHGVPEFNLEEGNYFPKGILTFSSYEEKVEFWRAFKLNP